ncbi:MAG: porin [Labrys sp. (in: a-proteobacteria)]|jgi:hypothetical protein
MRLVVMAVAIGLAGMGAAQADTFQDKYRCAMYGEGFIYSPSSGFCVKVSGHVRADYYTGRNKSERFGSSVGLGLDARTETGFGTARIVLETPDGVFD